MEAAEAATFKEEVVEDQDHRLLVVMQRELQLVLVELETLKEVTEELVLLVSLLQL
jgi:hypothetical protein